jgi:hypothetical protein
LLRGLQLVRELVRLRRMFAKIIRLREQAFDARDFGFNRVNLCFHAFEFALFLERKFAQFRFRRSGVSGECR